MLPPLAYAQPDQPPAAPILAAPPMLAARSYLLYDYTSNQILVNQNGDERMEPASLTKLMTAYLAFDALKHGTLTIDQKLTVPASAVRNRDDESRMLLEPGQKVKVDDLLRGLIVESGNDAAITLADNIAGSEAGFVDMMNEEAKQMGMNNTHFANPVGLPDAQNYTTAERPGRAGRRHRARISAVLPAVRNCASSLSTISPRPIATACCGWTLMWTA